jgi:hypothetical protein
MTQPPNKPSAAIKYCSCGYDLFVSGHCGCGLYFSICLGCKLPRRANRCQCKVKTRNMEYPEEWQ